MTDDRHSYGQSGEQLAVAFLEANGYTILERNFRTRLGEIDIIARHKGVLVFVEVKARRSRRHGDPKWALTPAKQRKISMTALVYLKRQGSTQVRARFDVVTVQRIDGRPQVELIRNAFELAYA
jgi:putative endonuclease